MTKLYRILGKRGRITIPFEIRQRVGFSYNDVLSFIESPDGRTVTVKREKICDNCSGTKETENGNEMTLEDFLDSLSAEQQRVALARMVAAHPGIFMFDEPMSALDAYLKSALEQNMLDLFDVCNRTVLYVSHDIDEACRLCQRICVMHNGHVEEIGSVEDVVRRPQTLAALRLTGCKNTSRACKIGDEEVEALDWGMTFNVGREVPDDVAYLGIRASYFHVDNRAERGRNSYDLRVARVSDSRFERLVLLDVPRVDAPTRLQWKVNKVGVPVEELPRAGDTLRMHFDASRIHLVCR